MSDFVSHLTIVSTDMQPTNRIPIEARTRRWWRRLISLSTMSAGMLRC